MVGMVAAGWVKWLMGWGRKSLGGGHWGLRAARRVRIGRGWGCARNEAKLGGAGNAANQDGRSAAQDADEGWGGFRRMRGRDEFCEAGQFAFGPLNFDPWQGRATLDGGEAGPELGLAVRLCRLRFCGHRF